MNRIPTIAAALLAILIPAGAEGQACVGTPLSDYGIGLEAVTSFGTDWRTHSASVAGMLADRIGLEGGFQLLTSDTLYNVGNGVHGRMAVSVPIGPISICPVVGGESVRFDEPELVLDPRGSVIGMERRISTIRRVPAGVAVGIALRLGQQASLIPTVEAGSVWERRITGVFERIDDTDRSRYVTGGLTAAWRRLYVRAERHAVLRHNGRRVFRILLGVGS